MEESQDEFDVELEKFGADPGQGAVDGDISGGRSWGRLLLVALLLVGTAYAISRLCSSSGDSFTDIAPADNSAEGDSAAGEETGTDDDATDDEDATATIEHSPEVETGDAVVDDGAAEADETGDVSDRETDANDDGAVEVEIELPGDDEE